MMRVILMNYPDEKRWIGVKQRALVTVGKEAKTAPTAEWKHRILEARHSPIRYLEFNFYLEDVPSWVAQHLRTHIHAQPYLQSQRNDRQNKYDRRKAPQDTPISLIWDINGEEIMTIANKRLCMLASPETREVVQMMCDEILKVCPEFEGLLVPNCEYHGGVCHEMYPCGKYKGGEAK